MTAWERIVESWIAIKYEANPSAMTREGKLEYMRLYNSNPEHRASCKTFGVGENVKKIFCDICDKEFKYEDAAVQTTMGVTKQVKVGKPGALGRRIVNISLKIGFDGGDQSGHIDICGDCRWDLINRQDPRPVAVADDSMPYQKNSMPIRNGLS